MNKGILIIDKIPEYCDEHCRFCDSFFNCQFVGDVEEAWRNKQRDSKCPIKQLPQKKDPFEEIENVINQKNNEKETDKKIDKIRSYSEGYNHCLDEILGGKDE